MSQDQILSKQEIDIIREHVESVLVQRLLISNHMSCLHRETKIRISIPLDEVNRSRFSYRLIKGKACLSNGSASIGGLIETDCYVAYGHWDTIPEFGESTIDIVEHLQHFFPKNPRPSIGLFTCQNGIQNTLDDFEKMCQSIISKLMPEKPLFIGIYNKTEGKWWGALGDLKRLTDEWTLNVSSALLMRQAFATITKRLSQINPHLLWAHIAHSEAGLIAKHCVTHLFHGLTPQEKQQVKKNLITLLYGAVASIPDGCVFNQINTYSVKDVTLHLVKKHVDKLELMPDFTKHEQNTLEGMKNYNKAWGKKESDEETMAGIKRVWEPIYNQFYFDEYPHTSKKNGYTITLVESLVDNLLPLVGDHGFTEATYQDALDKNIKFFRKERMIYDRKKMF